MINSLDIPPFILVSNPINFIKANRVYSADIFPTTRNIYFPEKATISDYLKYIPCGRVYSSVTSGDHFCKVCYKIIDDINYLIRIDNLDKKIINVTSDAKFLYDTATLYTLVTKKR